MVRAIDNRTLCDNEGCGDNQTIDPELHPRVVNMSIDHHRYEQCPMSKAAESNAVLGQGILYGVRQNRDILWVFAAGNGAKDAGCETPAGLTGTFPLNTMAVAAAIMTGTSPDDASATLWPSSNFGPFVTVAAPGVELHTIREAPDGYTPGEGTSLAAPIVSGLAALIFSQKPNYTARKVKQCIVQNADIDLPGYSFNVINAGEAMPPYTDTGGTVKNDCRPGAIDTSKVTKLDVVLLFDTTFSMNEEIAIVKAKAQDIITRINDAMGVAATTPAACGNNECCAEAAVCFAVANFEDYPASYGPPACGSTYSATYGSAGAGDKAFHEPVALKLTESTNNNIGTITAAIDTLAIRSGFDLPESYGRAFWEVANSVKNAKTSTDSVIGFRSDTDRKSLKIIISFGDDMPHDTNLNGSDLPCRTGIDIDVEDENPADDPCTPRCADNDNHCKQRAGLRIPNPPEPNPYDTGVDPGPDDVCGGEFDIDFQEDALMGLIEQKVRLVHIDSSENVDFIPYWSVWTQATGGAFARIKRDGTSLDEQGFTPDYLPTLIVELLASIPVE
jgi:hypothetical protein